MWAKAMRPPPRKKCPALQATLQQQTAWGTTCLWNPSPAHISAKMGAQSSTPPRVSPFSRKKRVNIISPRLKNIYITWDQRSLMTCRENYSGRNTSFINHSTRYSVPQVYAQLNLEFICPWTKESGSQSRSLSRSWRNTSGKKKIWILLSRPRIHSQLQ